VKETKKLTTYYIRPTDKIFDDEKQRQTSYRRVFSGEEGEAVLFDMLSAAGFFRMSFDKNAPEQTAFNEGKKEMCRHIINLLECNLIPQPQQQEANL
jgi:hypothetical protein